MSALDQEGYSHPTPIQLQSIPVILKGSDILGCAQTGTGKTAAFSIPMIQLLSREHAPKTARGEMRALILTPTRELAIQIDESIKAYGRHTGIRSVVIFGGVPQNPQVQAMRSGTDILIATPGRLLDLAEQGILNFDKLSILVLDEADRMLDMGFIHDIRKILKRIPSKRQTLFFSATMPSEIAGLAATMLKNPVSVSVNPVSSTAKTVRQSVYYVEKPGKPGLLIHLLKNSDIPEALVFTRTKHGADKLVRVLNKSGISAQAIHGNKSQNARQRALGDFKNREIQVLVATDIAARGIDVEELSHVINYDIPNVPETYVHRIGRTGRAGASGMAISFCDQEERTYVKDIQKLTDQTIPVVMEHPFESSQSTVSVHTSHNSNMPLTKEKPQFRKNSGYNRPDAGKRNQGNKFRSSGRRAS